MRTSTVRLVAAVAVSAGAFTFATRSSQAAPARTRGALVLTSFVQNGRTDVRRNERLEFKFSVQVRKGSVDDRSIRVDEVSGASKGAAIGARIVRGNVVTFDPQRTQRNYDASKEPNAPFVEKDNPTGFSSYQDFEVEVAAQPESSHTVKSTTGGSVLAFFSGTFTTNSSYDDPVPGQPYFVGDHGTGLLGFEPPRSGATGLVDEDALVVLEFSEPILIDTLDPSSTVIVTRITVNEQIPGYVKADPTEPSGRRFFFVPSVGFGSDTANFQGWDVQVTLTTGITDLAGNALKRPVILPVFRTRYVSGKASCSSITESFNDQKKMDAQTTATGGEWNTIEKGALRGGGATAFPAQVYQPTVANTVPSLVRTRVAEPLVAKTVPPGVGGGCQVRPTGSRVQMLYVPAEVGAEGAIVGVGWGPSSNALFASTHPEIIISMGHTSLGGLGVSFAGNVNIGSPQQVYKGQYDIPQAKNINPPLLDTGYWDWPTFQTPFEWNGVDNLVFDSACDGANNCQILRVGFVPAVVAYSIRRAASLNYKGTNADFTTDSVIYDIRFKKRRRKTQAISAWYELASDKPIFATPIVSPVGQPGGVTVQLEVEGADGRPDPFVVGGFIADPTTGTGFTEIASEIDGHRFFRFRLSMYANLSTNQTARIASVQFPYCF